MAKRGGKSEVALVLALFTAVGSIFVFVFRGLFLLTRRISLDIQRDGRSSSKLSGPDAMPEWEDPRQGRGTIVPASRRMFMTYRDAKGDVSKREITMKSVRPMTADDVGVWAWCHLRREARLFLSTRILSLADCDTGEVIEAPHRWLCAIAIYGAQSAGQQPVIRHPREVEAEARAETAREAKRVAAEEAAAKISARKAAAAAVQAEKDAITTWKRDLRLAVLGLVYLAKRDGRMDEADRTLIVAFVTAAEQRDGLSLGWSDVPGRLKSATCDQAQFLAALKMLRSGDAALRKDFVTVTQQLVARGAGNAESAKAAGWVKALLGGKV